MPDCPNCDEPLVPTDNPVHPWLCRPCQLIFSDDPKADNPWTDARRLRPNKRLRQLLLTNDDVRLLAQALAVAAMEDLHGDLRNFNASRASRIVWAHAMSPDASSFRRDLGPLATALAEMEANNG